jgi:hypothetical protein
MKHLLSIFSLAAGLSLASVANASVTTYTFATSNETLAQGSTYCATYSTTCGSVPTVGVYAEQTTSSSPYTFVTPVTTGPWWDQTSTESGLFTVTDTPNHFGTGIAPYNPSDGSGGNFSNQQGITDGADNTQSWPDNQNGNDNILLLKLSDFAAGSTLSLLLQAGVTGDSFTVYTSTGSTPTQLDSGTGGMTKVGTYDVDESGNSQPTTPQVTGLTITGLNSSTTGWIAIQADCHYMLLDQLSVNSPSGVPEPRFYGMLLAGLVGLAGMAYQRRRAAQANA